MRNFNALIIALSTSTLMMMGCGNGKNITPADQGEVMVELHCRDAKHKGDSDYFRSFGKGVSMSSDIAMQKARTSAEAELARTIGATVESVTDKQATEAEYNNKAELTQMFNSFTRVVVKQELRGAVVVCDKLTQKGDGTYTSYMALELSGESVAKAYEEKISDEEILKAHFNYENFKKTFEEEMSKQR